MKMISSALPGSCLSALPCVEGLIQRFLMTLALWGAYQNLIFCKFRLSEMINFKKGVFYVLNSGKVYVIIIIIIVRVESVVFRHFRKKAKKQKGEERQ